MMRRAEGSTPYEMVNDPDQYDLPRIKAAAELVGDLSVPIGTLTEMLNDRDSGVRYWAVEAFLARIHHDAWKGMHEIRDSMSDESPSVRIKAAETLCMLGQCIEALEVLVNDLDDERGWIALQSAISLRQLGDRTEPILEDIHRIRAGTAGDIGTQYSGNTGYGGYNDAFYNMFIGFAMDQLLLMSGESAD